MSCDDDFEAGAMFVGTLVVAAGLVFAIFVVTRALWSLHPAIAIIPWAPVAGGAANVAIQWFRRRRRGESA